MFKSQILHYKNFRPPNIDPQCDGLLKYEQHLPHFCPSRPFFRVKVKPIRPEFRLFWFFVCSVFYNMRLTFVSLKLICQGECEPNIVVSLNFEPIPRMLPSEILILHLPLKLLWIKRQVLVRAQFYCQNQIYTSWTEQLYVQLLIERFNWKINGYHKYVIPSKLKFSPG